MSDGKVVAFRPRRPSKTELTLYESITRNWSPQMRQLMFPRHFAVQGNSEPPRKK